MSATGGLEESYRRMLRWYYPPSYRLRHEEEILGVLLATAAPGQRRPGAGDALDLLWSAVKIRLRLVLRGAGSQPWAAALALAGVALPLLMVLFKLTLFLDRGAQYGFGSPADILVGGYGDPGAYSRLFQLNPYSVALTANVTSALTAGPLPALILAGLVCLRRHRAAALFAALVPLAYLGLTLANGYFLVGNPRVDVTLYAYGLEALILVTTPGAPLGWRGLRWRPSALLAVATVAAGIGMNGGLGPLLPHRLAPAGRIVNYPLGGFPHGFIDRTLGVEGQWGHWLLYQGTLVAVVALALTIMLVSSPANRRVLLLFAVPFVLGTVIYLLSLANPPLPGAAGNALAAAPLLLMLLLALMFPLVRTTPAGPDIPSRPATPGA